MGKNKKKKAKEPAAQEPLLTESRATPEGVEPEGAEPSPSEASPEPLPPAPRVTRLPKSLFRRLLPDLVKVGLAFAVIGFGVAVWLKPPLIRATFPYVSYRFGGQVYTDALLYRPLAMPTRYYIQLPRQLAGRYTWFAVDRRREVAALSEAPSHRFLGKNAIKRSDPLGLDLEFRKLDDSEWQVDFFEDAISFSNALLSISMDTKKGNHNASK
jgi:hypothetical protein